MFLVEGFGRGGAERAESLILLTPAHRQRRNTKARSVRRRWS
jgi:hypothetical protein